MIEIGYHASHEQFSPSALLRYTRLAADFGFNCVNSSDHLKPWSERQGHSGFSFAWLGAAMGQTEFPFSMVCAPGYRYHPVIVAQAIATLAEMFPARFSVALGSGEALNERVTGEKWPSKPERNQRLFECVTIIRDLLAGKSVSHRGRVVVEDAKLYSLPSVAPRILGAAVSAQTASWVGSWTDGLMTVNRPPGELAEVVAAFNENGGREKPKVLKVQVSMASTSDGALAGAFEQWRTNVVSSSVLGELSTPDQFEAAAAHVRIDDIRKLVHILTDTAELGDLIRMYLEMGFERVILHNVNRDQEYFIREVGEQLLLRPVE